MKGLVSRITVLAVACLALIAPASLWSYSDSDNNNQPVAAKSDAERADELMRTIAERARDLQQKLANLEAQRQTLDREAAELAALRERINAIASGSARPVLASLAPEAAAGAVLPVIPRKPAEHTTAAPLFFRIGSAEFTPGGFLEFTGAMRSKNVGSGIATSFGGVPLASTPAGRLSETRFGAQASRLSLKVTSRPGNINLTGYVEADFLGTQPAGGYVTSNSNTLRMRLYWADVQRGKWEVLGGQSWSMLTPNRNGLSAAPADLFLGLAVDPNYLVGLTWTRAPQFRVVHHTTKSFAVGVSLENPEQFVGTGVVLPSSFPSSLVDNGSNLSTPGMHPDIITKAAYDGRIGGRGIHAEVAGLYRSFRIVSPIDNRRVTQPAGGGAVNLSVETLKNLRLVVNTFYTNGGGRYIAGLGPDMIVRPDYTISNVRSGSALSGFEYQLNPNWIAYGYYGLAYFQRNTEGSGKGLVGFGGSGSATSVNRSIHEPTIGLTRVFWKKADLGAFQVGVQYAYLKRNLWWAAAGTPGSAQNHMVLTNIRYVLP